MAAKSRASYVVSTLAGPTRVVGLAAAALIDPNDEVIVVAKVCRGEMGPQKKARARKQSENESAILRLIAAYTAPGLLCLHCVQCTCVSKPMVWSIGRSMRLQLRGADTRNSRERHEPKTRASLGLCDAHSPPVWL